jgi:protein-S-isoprenylcysteine O-methyltransferase Ste14
MTTANICAFLWIIFVLVWLMASLKTKHTSERELFSSRLLYGIPIGIGSYLMFTNNLPFAWERTQLLARTTRLAAAVICLTAAGISFAIWARFYLGRNWSSAVTIKIGHELIRTGPYARVRHPIYFGLLVALAGTGLARDKLIALPAIALLWLGFWIKSRMEERFMYKAFGEQYVEYTKSTGALIPRFRL